MNGSDIEVLSKCSALLESLPEGQRALAARYLAGKFDAEGVGVGGGRQFAGAPKRQRRARRVGARGGAAPRGSGSNVDLARVVNLFKAGEGYESLSELVLDQNDLLNRVLVALAVYRQCYGDENGLTSGEIAQFYMQLGIKIGVPSVSTTLSGRAKQYVISDTVRSKGVIMRYRLSRYGVQKAKELGIEA